MIARVSSQETAVQMLKGLKATRILTKMTGQWDCHWLRYTSRGRDSCRTEGQLEVEVQL